MDHSHLPHTQNYQTKRPGNVTCLSERHGTRLTWSNSNALWFKWGAVNATMVSLMTDLLSWVALELNWDVIWFNPIPQRAVTFILSIARNPVLASPVGIHCFHMQRMLVQNSQIPDITFATIAQRKTKTKAVAISETVPYISCSYNHSLVKYC